MKKTIKKIWGKNKSWLLWLLLLIFVCIVALVLANDGGLLKKESQVSEKQAEEKTANDYQSLSMAIEKAFIEGNNEKADFYLAKYLAKSLREKTINEGLETINPLIGEKLSSPISYISGWFNQLFLDWFVLGTYKIWDVPEDYINESDFSFVITEASNGDYLISITAYPYSESWIVIEQKEGMATGDALPHLLILGDYKRKPFITFKNLKEKTTTPYEINLDIGDNPLQFIWPPEFYDLDNDNIPEIWIRYNRAWASGFSQELAIYKIKDNKEIYLFKRFSGEAEGIARRLENGQIEVAEGMPADSSEGHLSYSKSLLTTWEYKKGDFNKVSEKTIPHILWNENWIEYYED